MDFPFPIPPDWHITRARASRSRVIAAWVVAGALFSFVVAWSAFGAEISTNAGDKQEHATLCSDAKSAALVGQAVDDQPDLVPEILQGMIRKHRCVFLPGKLSVVVTMQQKVSHVAATDVWQVDWDGETWFVPIDAPREPDL